MQVGSLATRDPFRGVLDEAALDQRANLWNDLHELM